MIGIVTNGKPHFIGTFVYQSDPAGGAPQEYVIIGGQQRITSIILFAKALYDLTDDADLKEDIRSNFIRHATGRGLRNKCRLRPNEFDRDTFEKLMADDGFDENNFSDDEKDSAMYRNYRFFREEIAKSNLTHEDFCDAIDKLNIVSICLDKENPQEIFESLNSTGLNLSQTDLVRNFLLMPLAYDLQTTLYKNYWLKIEELLRPSNSVEKFMVQYLITKRKSNAISDGNRQLSNKNLYEVFKVSYKKFFDADAETCLRDMLRYAELFKRCLFGADTVFADLSALDKKFYELTFLLKADNAPIILMYLLDRSEQNHFDEATFIKFVDAMISLAFRAKACKRNGIDQQFAGNVLARLDKENPLTEKAFWQAITFGSGDRAFPNDNDFQAALMNTDLQDRIKSDGFKYLLYSLERAEGTQTLLAYSDVAVEQILPKKPGAAWKKYLTERGDLQAHEPWIQALGNQTLVNASERVRGDLFEQKKIRYARSCFSFTKALSGDSQWTSKQIQARAQKLASAAVKVWTLPEEFNATIQNATEIFKLDSGDFNAFTWTKPATLSVFGKEMKMTHWNRLLWEIAKQLYALDKDNFRKAAQLENVPKRLFQTKPTNFKIDDGFYIKIDFDTKTCLRMAKILADNFDKLGDTNCKDEIWFTLQPQQG